MSQKCNQLLCYVSPNSFHQLLALEFSNNARIIEIFFYRMAVCFHVREHREREMLTVCVSIDVSMHNCIRNSIRSSQMEIQSAFFWGCILWCGRCAMMRNTKRQHTHAHQIRFVALVCVCVRRMLHSVGKPWKRIHSRTNTMTFM